MKVKIKFYADGFKTAILNLEEETKKMTKYERHALIQEHLQKQCQCKVTILTGKYCDEKDFDYKSDEEARKEHRKTNF